MKEWFAPAEIAAAAGAASRRPERASRHIDAAGWHDDRARSRCPGSGRARRRLRIPHLAAPGRGPGAAARTASASAAGTARNNAPRPLDGAVAAFRSGCRRRRRTRRRARLAAVEQVETPFGRHDTPGRGGAGARKRPASRPRRSGTGCGSADGRAPADRLRGAAAALDRTDQHGRLRSARLGLPGRRLSAAGTAGLRSLLPAPEGGRRGARLVADPVGQDVQAAASIATFRARRGRCSAATARDAAGADLSRTRRRDRSVFTAHAGGQRRRPPLRCLRQVRGRHDRPAGDGRLPGPLFGHDRRAPPRPLARTGRRSGSPSPT